VLGVFFKLKIMKTILVILLMLLSTVALSNNHKSVVVQETQYTQFNTVKLKLPDYGSTRNREFHYGHGMMIGGGSFMLAGILTGNNPVGLSGPEYQPITSQPGRLAAILTGAVVFLSGAVVTITF
jgi:hypothetical protein